MMQVLTARPTLRCDLSGFDECDALVGNMTVWKRNADNFIAAIAKFRRPSCRREPRHERRYCWWLKRRKWRGLNRKITSDGKVLADALRIVKDKCGQSGSLVQETSKSLEALRSLSQSNDFTSASSNAEVVAELSSQDPDERGHASSQYVSCKVSS